MKKVNKTKTNTNVKKRVSFNLRKNRTRKFNKKENILRKQKRRQRQTGKKQKKNRRQKQNKSLRKNMKGGAIPFSEITEVYDNIKHSFNDAIDVFKDNPTTVANNPIKHSINPSVSNQFQSTSITNRFSYKLPDLKSTYDNAYSS